MTAIHRLIEVRATSQSEAPAVIDRGGTLTYRVLNLRANAAARRLIACGLRRGGRVTIRMDQSAELALRLLAVLKAGGMYSWICPPSPTRDAKSMAQTAGVAINGEPVELEPLVSDDACSSANLPILTRGSDIACVLPGAQSGELLVPHETIAALATSTPHHAVGPVPWTNGAFEFWVPLIEGRALDLSTPILDAAA